MQFFCYIVECSDGTFYTGWTTNPDRRIRQHNNGKGARYTLQRGPVKLVYVEEMQDRHSAMLREISIKKLTHAQKKRLVQTYILQNKINTLD